MVAGGSDLHLVEAVVDADEVGEELSFAAVCGTVAEAGAVGSVGVDEEHVAAGRVDAAVAHADVGVDLEWVVESAVAVEVDQDDSSVFAVEGDGALAIGGGVQGGAGVEILIGAGSMAAVAVDEKGVVDFLVVDGDGDVDAGELPCASIVFWVRP